MNTNPEPQAPTPAAFYEAYWSKTDGWTPDMSGTNADEEKLFRELLKPDMKLIDYGCGSGERYGSSMAARGVRYHGFDISETALQRAAALGLDVRPIATDGSIDFEDNSADIAICFEVLEHLLEPDLALSAIRKALKPGAVAVVSVPNSANYVQRIEFLLTGFWNPGGSPHTARRAPWRDPHIRFFNPTMLRQMTDAAGFKWLRLHPEEFSFAAFPVLYRKTEWHPFLKSISRPFAWLSSAFPNLFASRLFAVVQKPA